MVSGDFWQTLKECGIYDIITKAKQKIITGKGGLCKAYKNEEEMKMVSQMTVGMKNFAEQYGIAIHDPTLIRRYRIVYPGQGHGFMGTSRDEAKEAEVVFFRKNVE